MFFRIVDTMIEFLKQTISILALLFAVNTGAFAQIISQFSWDDPLVGIEVADIGPDGTSFSAVAISDAGGVGGTNGLNASTTPKTDVNMVIPGSPTFDVDGIDVSFDYQREESQCDWFTRGSSLIIDGSNNFSVSYRVDDGAGGFTTINSGNQYNIPNDDTYRNYRFVYLPVSGEGIMMLDGVIIWTNDGPDNRPMYWTGAGDVTVGSGCDGSGNDDTFMDNLIVASVTYSPLPIELLTFDLEKAGDNVKVRWESASETNNDFYSVERSLDGITWVSAGTVKGAGNSSERRKYTFVDHEPFIGLNYYRLSQTDFDGSSETFDPKTIVLQRNAAMSVFPNPANEQLTITFDAKHEFSDIKFYNLLGQEVSADVKLSEGEGFNVDADISNLESGVYILNADGKTERFVKE